MKSTKTLTLMHAHKIDLSQILTNSYSRWAENLFVDCASMIMRDDTLQVIYQITYSRKKAEDLTIFVSRSIDKSQIGHIIPDNATGYQNRLYHINQDASVQLPDEHPIKGYPNNKNMVAFTLYGHEDSRALSYVVRNLDSVPNYVKEIFIIDDIVFLTPSSEFVELYNSTQIHWNTLLFPSWLEVYKVVLISKQEDSEEVEE